MRRLPEIVSRVTVVLFAATLAGCAATPPGLPPPTRHLATAESAARWLVATARQDGEAWTWAACPDVGGAAVHSLYSGGAGVALFFSELHAATGSAEWLEAAERAARGLQRAFDVEAGERGAGLFTGVGGMLLAMQVVYERSRDPDLDAAIRRGLAWFAQRAANGSRDAAITFGPVTDVISGDAGIGELMLWLAARRPDSPARAIAAGIARHLAAIAEPAEPGYRWKMSPTYPRAMPNYSHGTGGVAAFLARAAELHPDALVKARGGGEWLLHLADERGMVFHHEPGGEDLFYWGWCHGPAGTSVLFSRLAHATGESRWADAARRPLQPVLQSGLPERRLAGLWNTVGQCCGTAGVSAYVLRLADGDARLLAFCERLAGDIARRATVVGDGRKWIQSEHRVRPELLQAQVGWAQGASGIGLALLELDAALRGRAPAVELPWATVRQP